MEVTCRFVRNCTLRKGRGRCKAGLEWSQLPILQAVVATPMVVAGQVDVLPFQLEAFAGLYPPGREGGPTSTHGNGTSLRDAREGYS
jgi:hypothetical protein